MTQVSDYFFIIINWIKCSQNVNRRVVGCKWLLKYFNVSRFILIQILFAAQLWKFNDETPVYRRHSLPHSGGFCYSLENKNGDWRYLTETWKLPNPLTTENKSEDEESEGQDIRSSQGSVLKANLNNRGMYLCYYLKLKAN